MQCGGGGETASTETRPSTETLTAGAAARTRGATAGHSVALTDLDGDGWAEVIVGAPFESSGAGNGGAVYVMEPTKE